MSTDIFRFEHSEVDDTGDLQTLKGTGYAGESFEDVHRVMPFGLASNAPAGSHAIAVASRGERSLVAALGLEHPDYRQKNLKSGQAAVYDQKGNVTSYLGGDGIWHNAGDRTQKLTGKVVNALASSGTASFGSSSGITYIGGDGTDGVYDWAMTASGPSTKVKIRIS